MKVKFKKLSDNAVTPSYAKPGDAGLDFVATSINRCDFYDEYGTGISMEIPEGYVGLIFPRSSITNKDLMLKNSVGVIDSSYRGEIKFRFQETRNTAVLYEVGEKIGQMIILEYPHIELEESDELSETERGAGGYGHTGK